MRLGVLAHIIVEIVVGVQVEHVLGNGVVVADVAEVAGLAVNDLEGDTARTASDDGFAGVQSLGDLDFESFTDGKLEGELGVGHQGVQD